MMYIYICALNHPLQKSVSKVLRQQKNHLNKQIFFKQKDLWSSSDVWKLQFFSADPSQCRLLGLMYSNKNPH